MKDLIYLHLFFPWCSFSAWRMSFNLSFWVGPLEINYLNVVFLRKSLYLLHFKRISFAVYILSRLAKLFFFFLNSLNVLHCFLCVWMVSDKFTVIFTLLLYRSFCSSNFLQCFLFVFGFLNIEHDMPKTVGELIWVIILVFSQLLNL